MIVEKAIFSHSVVMAINKRDAHNLQINFEKNRKEIIIFTKIETDVLIIVALIEISPDKGRKIIFKNISIPQIITISRIKP
ncbi:MAG: hypothetical protein PUG00_08175 [Clostridiales bacterium]|nr:hypothetical protein [Clostridiales bacterium]